MKALIISDIHGNTETIEKLDQQFKEADCVFFAGDFAEFDKAETGLPALEALCKKHEVIFAVIGNCDEPEFVAELENRDICVERQMSFFEGLAIAGSGGGTKFTGTTPNERTEEDIIADYRMITDQGEQKWNNLVAIMHNPPKDTDCDMIPGGIHVGSQALREFIEKYEPLLVVTGHIHESAGVSKIGATTVVNPGSLAEGKFAVTEIEKNNGTFEIKSLELKSL